MLPPAFLEEYYRVRPTQGIHNLYKFRLGTTASETRVTNIAIAPLVSKNFSVIGRLIIVDDITERIGLESQLSQAEKLSSIGLLAAGVAHEVNTPLAVISSYAQMLAKQVHGDDRQSALLEKITKQTFRASEIVNSLLNFSRTSGAEFADVDLNRVIKDTLTLLEHQFKTARINVQQDLYPDLPHDPRQYRQVAAGVLEFVPEREGRHVRRWHADHQYRSTGITSRLGLPTQAAASRRNIFIASMTRSSPPRTSPRPGPVVEQAWDFPSPTESFRNTQARSGSIACPDTERHSLWNSPW